MTESGEKAEIVSRESIVHSTDNSEFSNQYDYAMVLKMDGEEGRYVPSNIAKFVIKQMTNAGLETFAYTSVQLDELIVLIRCPVS
jgi:hypothetical protein